MVSRYAPIGKINKPLGTKGELKVYIDDIFWDDFLGSDHFFLKFNGSFVPYFIEDIRETNHVLLKIEEVDDPEMAVSLANKEIYLECTAIRSEAFTRKSEVAGYVGFTIFDKGMFIGIIDLIEQMPQQEIAWVNVAEKRIAIPLVDALILSVNQEKKEINMNLPDGILDL